MCGRSRCTLTREQVAKVAGVALKEFVDGDKYHPVENMGPGRYGPVLLQYGGEKVDSKKHVKTHLRAMRWGLVPSFTKANGTPDHFLMFNARSENVQERPAFKRVLETKRCVVLCEGYYEWQQVGKREKQPYYFYREGSLMKFAGLYDHWKNEAGEVMYTYTVLTTTVAPEIKWLHTRMPVILSDNGVDRWLSGAKFEDLKDLLTSYRSNDLKWHPVDKKVGSMQFQSKDCAKKIDIKHAGDITSFFGGKTEKHESLQSPPIAPSERAKMEKVVSSDTTTVPSVMSKNEEHDWNPDTSPKKQAKPFSAQFVPASSLVDKRCKNDEKQDSMLLQSPNKRRRVSLRTKTSNVKPKKSRAKVKSPSPKQSSLDSFFSKSPK
ncbi:unnamed protein product [Peronospora belbahrii]|uniref:Embryonic stem cell-specific 5-hydroxymethylcytosine-binding protein n=1 Tax=Peronospora belbahrii TaxID=622444 RepID=A0AAU9L399_9STRA|nr:unnamed protein product [Peronospora belbahrii]CAH0522248.1 unnamed protein product [Peronospora belbahrii]